MNTVNTMKADAAVLKSLIANTKELLRSQRENLKLLQKDIKFERAMDRQIKADLRATKKAAIEKKRAEAIARVEARLAKMKLKASRKNGPVKVFTKEEIESLNAA